MIVIDQIFQNLVKIHEGRFEGFREISCSRESTVTNFFCFCSRRYPLKFIEEYLERDRIVNIVYRSVLPKEKKFPLMINACPKSISLLSRKSEFIENCTFFFIKWDIKFHVERLEKRGIGENNFRKDKFRQGESTRG